MMYTIERVQVDVKSVSMKCLIEELKDKSNQYTAIDEYNNFLTRPLNWLSPKEKYLEYVQG